MENSGHSIKLLVCCGGLSKNKLYVQTHADVAGELVQPALHVTCLVFDIRKKKFLCVCPSAGLPILLPDVTESVLLGTAILGACASGEFATIQVCVTRGEKSWRSMVNGRLWKVPEKDCSHRSWEQWELTCPTLRTNYGHCLQKYMAFYFASCPFKVGKENSSRPWFRLETFYPPPIASQDGTRSSRQRRQRSTLAFVAKSLSFLFLQEAMSVMGGEGAVVNPEASSKRFVLFPHVCQLQHFDGKEILTFRCSLFVLSVFMTRNTKFFCKCWSIRGNTKTSWTPPDTTKTTHSQTGTLQGGDDSTTRTQQSPLMHKQCG